MKRMTLLMLVLVATMPWVSAQKVKLIRLKPGKARTTLHSFRISGVLDERADTTSIGIMRAGLLNKPAMVNIEGGAAAGFTAYVRMQVQSAENVPTFSMRIKKLSISESTGNLRERATLRYNYTFYKGEATVMQYEGESYAETGLDASAYIGELLRQSIHQTLEKADADWAPHAADTIQKIQVMVAIAPGSGVSNNIFWSKSRPLTISDYQAKPDDMSRADAATYSGISIGYSVNTIGTSTKLSVTIMPLFFPSRSWFRAVAKTPDILAHEQLHFDITALCACLLADKIRKASISPADYQAQLEALQAESNTLLQEMQDHYDSETSHGRIAAKQAEWVRNIRQRLEAPDCY